MEQFQKLLDLNSRATQTLERTPEPAGVTSGETNVSQYNRVLETNMTANYCASLDFIHRVRGTEFGGRALDLCSGPGLLSRAMIQHLKFAHVLGVDLSDSMVAVAKQNAKQASLERRLDFNVGDILDIQGQDEFDLVSFTNSAHHMPSLKDVISVLTMADRLTKPSGIVVLTDIGRLKNSEITDGFVSLAGSEFLEKGMPDMYQDFLNSMYAGWTADELASCIPANSARIWIQMAPTGLTSYQALIGLPVGRKEIFLRESFDWPQSGLLKSREAFSDWNVMREIMRTADYRLSYPVNQKNL